MLFFFFFYCNSFTVRYYSVKVSHFPITSIEVQSTGFSEGALKTLMLYYQLLFLIIRVILKSSCPLQSDTCCVRQSSADPILQTPVLHFLHLAVAHAKEIRLFTIHKSLQHPDLR